MLGAIIHIRLEDETLASAYPWEDVTVLVKITGIYPKFIVGTVLTHKNSKGFRKSSPYNIIINNYDLTAKRITIIDLHDRPFEGEKTTKAILTEMTRMAERCRG